MEKEDLKTIFIVIGVILITVFILVKIRDFSIKDTEKKNDITGASTIDSELNIKQAAPTPTKCTPGQNCGSPTCAVATGRGGGCGCGR